MPPELDTVPVPTTRGDDARRWLEAYGHIPIDCSIRSGHHEDCADPFYYYLRHRLGLVPALSHSKAMNRGSWFHVFLQHFGDPLINEKAEATLRLREKELMAMCRALGIGAEREDGILFEEKKDFATAKAWWEASKHISVNKEYGTFHKFFSAPHWRLLGTELCIGYRRKDMPKVPCVCTIDQLWFHEGQTSLYINDGKTCDCSPLVRAATCPIEFQTMHNLNILEAMLPTIIDRFQLPHNTRLGGMSHLIMQKPTIEFGMKDRPLLYYESIGQRSKVSGRVVCRGKEWEVIIDSPDGYVSPHGHSNLKFDKLEDALKGLHLDTGKTPKAVYAGEPDLTLFTKRCVDWCVGKGEYADKFAERQADPPVNFSFTWAKEMLDADHKEDYLDMLRECYSYATREPRPSNFPRRAGNCRRYGKLSPYHHFYLCPVKDWPEIIQRERYIIEHRDEELPNAMILGDPL